MTPPTLNTPINPSSSKRVLIVEDEPLIAYDLKTEIEDNNHHVVGVCSTAASAIQMAGDLRPDVIVMDIGLLGSKTGIEAGRDIRDRFDIGCIFVSATLDRVETDVWNDIRPVALIRKPYRDDALAKAVSKAGLDWKTIGSSSKTVLTDPARPESGTSMDQQKRLEPAAMPKSAVKNT